MFAQQLTTLSLLTSMDRPNRPRHPALQPIITLAVLLLAVEVILSPHRILVSWFPLKNILKILRTGFQSGIRGPQGNHPYLLSPVRRSQIEIANLRSILPLHLLIPSLIHIINRGKHHCYSTHLLRLPFMDRSERLLRPAIYGLA